MPPLRRRWILMASLLAVMVLGTLAAPIDGGDSVGPSTVNAPVSSALDAVEAEPAVVEPERVAVKPELTAVEPAPVAVKSKPTAVPPIRNKRSRARATVASHPRRKHIRKRFRRAHAKLHNATEPIRQHKTGIASYTGGMLAGFATGTLVAFSSVGNLAVASAIGAGVAEGTSKGIEAHYKRKKRGIPRRKIDNATQLIDRLRESARKNTMPVLVAAAGGVVGAFVGKWAATQLAPMVNGASGAVTKAASRLLSTVRTAPAAAASSSSWLTETAIQAGTGMATSTIVRDAVHSVLHTGIK